MCDSGNLKKKERNKFAFGKIANIAMVTPSICLALKTLRVAPASFLPSCKRFFYSTSFYLLYITQETAVTFYLLFTPSN
jgi:hypothetical protein